MPALNFQERWADPVESGEKGQTIRPERWTPIKVGDRLYLYTGMRTKKCRLLRETTCKEVTPIIVGTTSIQIVDADSLNVHVDRRWLKAFAQKDGFLSWREMHDWFRDRYGLPFEGVLIEW